MATLTDLINSIFTMEGSNSPNSVNQKMIAQYGLYDPGHLVYANQAGATPVKIGGTTWAGFTSQDAATQAVANQISLDASRGHTLETFISKYAPPSQNNTSSYISTVASWLGLDPSTPLSDIISGGTDVVPTGNDSVYSSPSSDSTNSLGIDTTTLVAVVGLAIIGAIAINS